jgi:hypothetical protein
LKLFSDIKVANYFVKTLLKVRPKEFNLYHLKSKQLPFLSELLMTSSGDVISDVSINIQ